ncbi:MAG: hypothetical protein R2811_05715 [Flavobacteriales bacterium]
MVAQFCYPAGGCAQQWAPLLDGSGSLTTSILRSHFFQRLIAAARRRLDAQHAPPDARPQLTVEVVFFTTFNVIALIALGLFILSDTYLPYARFSGPLPIAITGFAVVLGAINLLRLWGRVANVSVLFLWALVVAVITGIKFDSHSVRVVEVGSAHASEVRARPSRWTAANWMMARIDSTRKTAQQGYRAFPWCSSSAMEVVPLRTLGHARAFSAIWTA